MPDFQVEGPNVKRLHLGAGKNALEGFINVDQCQHPGIDLLYDLEKAGEIPLPYLDNTFDEMYSSHTIEHIRNPLPMMQELHRVAKPDCIFLLKCPYGSSDDAWENPTHVRGMFLGSWGYFSQPFFWREDYGYRGDWYAERIVLVMMASRGYNAATKVEEVHRDLLCERNVVAEMIAFLRAVKPIRAMEKELQKAPKVEFALP